MNRFMGMMPSSEVRKEQSFRDQYGLTITIQAGEKGWTILWADRSSTYKDIDATTEINWQAAFDHLAERGCSDLTPLPQSAGER